jgi:hypothetical protein
MKLLRIRIPVQIGGSGSPTLVLRRFPTKREGEGSLFESLFLVKSPKPRNKAQRKADYKNYDAITMSRNYDTKLSTTRNYEEKLSQEITHKGSPIGN